MDKSQWHDRAAFLKAKGWSIADIMREVRHKRDAISRYFNTEEAQALIKAYQDKLKSEGTGLEGLSAETAAKVQTALEGEYSEEKYNEAINAMLKEDLLGYDQRRANLLKIMLEERNRREKQNTDVAEVVVMITEDLAETLNDYIRLRYKNAQSN